MTRRDMRRKVLRLVKTRCFFSDPVIIAKAYGVTQTAAVPNAPGCWPRRHTWHSEELAGGILAKPRVAIDYAYVSTRKVASGSNDPNIYVSRMDTYKLGELQMRKLSWWLREEREKAERKEGRGNGGHPSAHRCWKSYGKTAERSNAKP